jgi:hypothetical protein
VTHPNARKGAAWELAIRRYLEEDFGRQVRRPRQEGARDVGDLHLTPFILQAKDVANLSLPATIRQAEQQAENAGEHFGVVVAKVRGRNVADGTVSMSLRTFRKLVLAFYE